MLVKGVYAAIKPDAAVSRIAKAKFDDDFVVQRVNPLQSFGWRHSAKRIGQNLAEKSGVIVLPYCRGVRGPIAEAQKPNDAQASFADAVNVAAFFLTNSCTLIGPCPVSVSTSSDIRS